MTYQIKLISLRCIQNQERDGDEIFMKMNGKVFFDWEKFERKFVSKLKEDENINAYDFRLAKISTLAGWEEGKGYTPDDFVFTGLENSTRIELWECDYGEVLRGRDERLGVVKIDESHIEKGETIVVFNDNDTEYEFTYIVLAE